ncbi:MAG: branched-chain amino acid ABC transporter substrate-binding protein [Candidatus Eremiobacteraeota bacterium]|nr:branched-chain amino acid ABC transporter substrate-binding protein [Candidatus Eremiobacteraeota bacterium]
MMIHTRRLRLALIAAAAASTGLLSAPRSACADFPPYAKIITIAVVAPLSGPQRQAGLDLSAGVQQAVDDANTARGIADFGWTMRSFDDQGDPGVAQQQAQFAMVDDSTSFVIGHLGADETGLALPTYHEQNMPVIIPTLSLAALTQRGYDDVFRLCPTDVTEGEQDGRYADRALKAKRVAVVYQENNYGADAGQGFMNYAGAGKTMTAKDFSIDNDLKQIKSLVDRVHSYKPDLLYVSGTGSDMAKVIEAMRTAGVQAPLLATQSFFDQATVKSLAHDADGMTVSACMPPVDRLPQAQSLIRRYQSAHGTLTPFAVFGYVAAQVAIAAARQARSGDRRTLDRQLSIGSFPTILGTWSFSRNGDPAQPNVYLYRYSAGNFKYVDSAYPSAVPAR